jgi:hypothetical protein
VKFPLHFYQVRSLSFLNHQYNQHLIYIYIYIYILPPRLFLQAVVSRLMLLT